MAVGDTGGSFFTRKTGGIPNYAILAGGAAALLIWRSRQTSSPGNSQQLQQQMAQLQQEEYLAQQEASLSAAGQGNSQPQLILLPANASAGGTPTASTPAAAAANLLTPTQYQSNPSSYFTANAHGLSPTAQYVGLPEQSLSGQDYIVPSYSAALALAQSGQGYAQTSPGVFNQEPFSYFAGSGTDVYQSIPAPSTPA